MLTVEKEKTEPDPDESTSVGEDPDPDVSTNSEEPDPDESMDSEEPDPDESMDAEEPDPDESVKAYEPDPDENGRDLDFGTVNDEIARIQDATAAAMTRLQNAITTLRQQATPAETTTAIKALSTIVRYAFTFKSFFLLYFLGSFH